MNRLSMFVLRSYMHFTLLTQRVRLFKSVTLTDTEIDRRLLWTISSIVFAKAIFNINTYLIDN